MDNHVEEDRWHVAKTLRPGQPGTVKLQRRYGNDLICVRYREDEDGTVRRVTVELLIEDHTIRHRWVWASIPRDRRDLRELAMRMGAEWFSAEKRWKMTRRTAKLLGLTTTPFEKIPTTNTAP